MKIEVLEHKGNNVKFRLSDSSPAFANAIRRLLFEVPTMAIDEVIIIENSSLLYDEVLSHRLGMIPLTTPQGVYNLPSQCVCEGHGCSNCETSLTLEKEGSELGAIETLYSKDLQPEDPDVKPVIENIPILRFTQGQKVIIQAIARLGLAKDHAKFQCAIASYKYEPIIEIDTKKSESCESLVDLCPPKILKYENKSLKVTDKQKCILCMQCVENCPEQGAINVRTTGKDFLFNVTSFGQIPVDKLLINALEILKEKGIELQSKIQELSVDV
ncbi:MAG: DNA-directed RNA polymerase subunit D [Candidatus Thorarchaeota archaeon]